MTGAFNDWAKAQGMTREEFIEEAVATVAVLGTMLLDENETPDEKVGWTVKDGGKEKDVRVTVHRIYHWSYRETLTQ